MKPNELAADLEVPSCPEESILQQKRDFLARKYYQSPYSACDPTIQAEIDRIINETECVF